MAINMNSNPLQCLTSKRCRVALPVFFVAILVFVISFIPVQNAHATHFCPCPCSPTAFAMMSSAVIAEHEYTRQQHFGTSGNTCERCGTERMGQHEDWLIDTLFLPRLLPAMMMMTEQLSAVMAQQLAIIGALLDAKIQLETQRLFDELAAEAHKDYHPSVGVCTFGTTIRSLSNVERRSEVMMAVMSQRSKQRQLGNANANAAPGFEADLQGRLEQFIKVYCDEDDNNKIRGDVIDPEDSSTSSASALTGLRIVCNSGGPDDRINKDIDFTHTVEMPMTLDIDFMDDPDNPTKDEEDLLAMGSYLYAHKVPQRIPATSLEIYQNQDDYIDMRSVVAKRSVAENSFFAIAGMKARGKEEGADDTFKYMQSLLEELGLKKEDAEKLYGKYPSYLAQMEVLAKNIYQRPEFYTDLYDKPANVVRKGVAMQAIDLMLERDLFKSQLRTESLISILLELEIIKNQEEVTNKAKNTDISATAK